MVQFLGYVDQDQQVSSCPPEGLQQRLKMALGEKKLLVVAEVLTEAEETTTEK